jgi:hypothetical protein
MPSSYLVSLMMEAVRTSETSVDNYFTRQYIPEDNSEHYTRRRENLKSHVLCVVGILSEVSSRYEHKDWTRLAQNKFKWQTRRYTPEDSYLPP